MGIGPFLSASAIVAIVAQRLVRQLCTYCKKRDAERRRSEKAGFNVAFDLEAYDKSAAAAAAARATKEPDGLYEVMVISDEIRDLTVERSSADDIRKIAVAQGHAHAPRGRLREGPGQRHHVHSRGSESP